jgi:hypothetical protein
VAIPTTLSRSTVTILVPGTVALSPWLLLLVQHTSATLGYKDYATLANAMVLAGVIVTGSICEGLGTFVELHWDCKRESELEIKENWHKYLSKVLTKNPSASGTSADWLPPCTSNFLCLSQHRFF